MDKEKAINYIETSFLSDLIKQEDVTDISFNGVDFYYVTNLHGRMKSDIVLDQGKVRDFLRQIANICECQFSFSNPYLDLSIGRYRLHATHQSVARVGDDGTVTFSLRIASKKIRINDDSDFFNPLIVELIEKILQIRTPIIIGGVTSSGKTEFQKYLLLKMPQNERVIVIDNVLELDQVRNEKIDLTSWRSDANNDSASAHILIKNALRNNPDWIILAEARGEEVVDVLNSAMTGMPIITTLHAKNVEAIPFRMGRMMMKSAQKIDYDEALKDIYYHFHFFFYLKKELSEGKIKRYISEIAFIDSEGNFSQLFSRNGKDIKFNFLPKEAISMLAGLKVSKQFREAFIK